jgi:hypothetical protein
LFFRLPMLATGAVDKNTQKRVISFSRKHKLLRISDAGASASDLINMRGSLSVKRRGGGSATIRAIHAPQGRYAQSHTTDADVRILSGRAGNGI